VCVCVCVCVCVQLGNGLRDNNLRPLLLTGSCKELEGLKVSGFGFRV
jgi:hypothetical protein